VRGDLVGYAAHWAVPRLQFHCNRGTAN
jgi:hypothetical protein